MKKLIHLLALIIVIYCVVAITLPKFIHTTASENHSDEKYQTWQEFLESGVQIEYDNSPVTINDRND